MQYHDSAQASPILVTGGTGKTGRRIVTRLRALGRPVRVASRSGTPAFDWDDQATWPAVLDGVRTAYISYAPDLAVPGATGIIQAFVDMAVAYRVERLVLLSGRGEDEARACEAIVQASGVEWTIVRTSWFNQNFAEGEFLDMVRGGTIALPAGNVPEPFVDADDIADVVTASLTGPGHACETYELTGPRLMTFAEVASELGCATGRDIRYVPVPRADFVAAVEDAGASADMTWLLDYLFGTVLDGRNASLADGVQRALGREPTDFAEFARRAAARGVWASG